MNHTPAQRRAIDSDAQNILVVAGPGSGKTATTVSRICRLIEHGTPPSKIVAITFTNAAARELERRLYSSAVDPQAGAFPRLGHVGTLHSFALRMLKEYGAALGYGDRVAIVGEEATADLIASKAQTLGCKMPIDKLLKMKADGPDMRKKTVTRRSVEELVLRGYYDDLREAGLVDFDSILSEFARMLQIDKDDYEGVSMMDFTHLFVDEVQDSSAIDWQIYDALPMAFKWFVGDQDQSIYAFRGGRPSLMQDYGKRLGVETHVLEDNFRSHREVCHVAQSLIEHNVGRIAKRTVSAKGVGGTVISNAWYNAGEEMGGVIHWIGKVCKAPVSEIAVLTRTNALAHDFREALKAAGIPVVEPPKSAFPADWPLAKALIDHLVNPENDTLAYFFWMEKQRRHGMTEVEARKAAHATRQKAARLGTSINRMLWNYGQGRVEDIGGALAAQDITAESRMLVATKIRQLPAGADLLQLALLMAVDDSVPAEASEGVSVLTLHGSKGREFDVVFIVGVEDEAIPGQRKSDGPEQVAEERRLLYVGVTRARAHLYLSHAASRTVTYGPKYTKIEPRTPSRFLKEMLES